MTSSLFPAFIKVEYHSAYAPHIMLLPTREIDIDAGTPEDSTILAWDDSQINWVTMVTALITEMLPLFTITVNFDRATLFNVPELEADPQPISNATIDLPGSDASPTYSQAVQLTATWRTSLFGISKLVLLDMESSGSFDKIISLSGQPALTAINDEWVADTNGWAGRDNGQPNVFISATKTLNEKLRRAYHQA